MKSLAIDQVFGEIGIRQSLPQMEVNRKPPEMKLKQLPGQLKVKSRAAEIEISYRRARYDLHSKYPTVYSKELARKGKQAAFKGIKEYVNEGDELAAIENKGKPIIAQAKRELKDDEKQLVFKWKHGAKIKVKPGTQRIKYELQDYDGVRLEVKPNWPQVRYRQGKVEIYQQKKSKIEIRLVDRRV